MATNFVKETFTDSARSTKLFFDTYGIAPLEFNAVDFDAAITFFKSRGFEEDAAVVTASTLLKQTILDNMSIQKILDTLSGFTNLQISSLVGEILNNNRSPISTLGFRVSKKNSELITRNVAV
jgi:hypothetical protein